MCVYLSFAILTSSIIFTFCSTQTKDINVPDCPAGYHSCGTGECCRCPKHTYAQGTGRRFACTPCPVQRIAGNRYATKTAGYASTSESDCFTEYTLAEQGQGSCTGPDRTKMVDERQCVAFAASSGLPYLKTMLPCYTTDYFGNKMSCSAVDLSIPPYASPSPYHFFANAEKRGAVQVQNNTVSSASLNPFFAKYAAELMMNQASVTWTDNGTSKYRSGSHIFYAYDGMDGLEMPPYRAYKASDKQAKQDERGKRRRLLPPTWGMRYVQVETHQDMRTFYDTSANGKHAGLLEYLPESGHVVEGLPLPCVDSNVNCLVLAEESSCAGEVKVGEVWLDVVDYCPLSCRNCWPEANARGGYETQVERRG